MMQIINLDDVGGKVYLKANMWSELKKFVFLFLLVGIFVHEIASLVDWIMNKSDK